MADECSMSSIAEALFAGLQGRWRLVRTFTSFSSALPSGSATGTATFERREGDELLQTEEGVFRSEGGPAIDFTRRYVFVLSGGELCVHFADSKGVRGGLFHRLAFVDRTAATGEEHLCVRDLYKTAYRFRWADDRLVGFEIDDEVAGPAKDWRATTVYERE